MAVDDPLIGKTLGDYTIQGLLGRGGMSRVYKGYDENLDRYAAVKVISGDFATTSEEEYTRRFQTEARSIARLRHENIVGVYQFGRTEGIYYMAQVFLEGKDLRSLMKSYAAQDERIPNEEILRIVRDITRALDYAHEQGVIHRDIKPSNIMLEKRTGRAILMDFGLALSVHEGTMGDTFGSAHYIAPEQAISSAKSVPQSDLYSLGIVIYEMLTGKVPFDDPSVMSVALKHLNELPPPPSMYNPQLPPAVEKTIMRLLDKEPTRRYANGWQLYSALVEAFEQDETDDEFDQTPVMDMLASRPSPLDSTDSSRPQLPEVQPIVEPSGGVAGRFARRRERKEAEAKLEAGEGLQIDEASLSSILDGYADPSELEMTDNSASVASDPGIARKRRSRRSRIGMLLFSSLLLIIIVGAAWLGLGLGDGDDGDDDSGDGVAVVALDQTATADAMAATATEAPTATEVSEQPTEAAVDVPTDAPTDVPTDAPTDIPTDVPTATATEPPTATDVPDTATPEPSPTAEPTAEPTVEPTVEPTEVAAVATEDVAPTAVSTNPAPNVRLLYSEESPGQGQFLLINFSNSTLDVSRLVFERERADGVVLHYEGSLWNRSGISDPPSAMPGLSCFQLVTTNGTIRTTSGGECPIFLGYYRTNIPERYFWLAQEPGSVFTVRDQDAETPMALCSVEAGECEFYITPVSGGSPAAAGVTPSMQPADEPSLRLDYDADSFLIVNISERQRDVSVLIFEQRMPNGAVRRFDASQWDRADMLEPPDAMGPGGCYQLVTADGTQHTPGVNECAHFLGWFRTSLTRRYFWLSDQEGAEFTVKLAGSNMVLTSCEIDAGECLVPLPAPSE